MPDNGSRPDSDGLHFNHMESFGYTVQHAPYHDLDLGQVGKYGAENLSFLYVHYLQPEGPTCHKLQLEKPALHEVQS